MTYIYIYVVKRTIYIYVCVSLDGKGLSRYINSWDSKSELHSSGTFVPWIWEHYVASKCKDQIMHSHSSISHENTIIQWTSMKPHKFVKLNTLMLQKSHSLWSYDLQNCSDRKQITGQTFSKYTNSSCYVTFPDTITQGINRKRGNVR